MRPADAQSAVSVALHKVAARVECVGAEAWSLSLENGCAVEARAHLDDVWLVVETTPVANARGECEAATEWSVLVSNAMLSGGVRRILDGRGGVARMRVEIPLDADIDLLRRASDVCTGIVRAAAAPAAGPAPSIQPESSDIGPDPELLETCRQTGWPCRAREFGSVEVDLDVPGGFHVATIERRGEEYAARVALLGEDGCDGAAASEARRRAVAVLLLRASGGLRMVRATGSGTGDAARVAFDVGFPERPSVGELSHALAALSVGCRIAAREASVLWADAELAGAYLERWDDGRKQAA